MTDKSATPSPKATPDLVITYDEAKLLLKAVSFHRSKLVANVAEELARARHPAGFNASDAERHASNAKALSKSVAKYSALIEKLTTAATA